MQKRIKYITFMLLVIILCSGCGREDKLQLNASESAQESTADAKKDTDSSQSADANMIYVYVCGAVVKPGVYELKSGQRIWHAIEKAGGLTEEASDSVNLAAPLEDGQMIQILTLAEAKSAEAAEADKKNGMVNINTADVTQLMELPGVGQSRAEDIIAYREEHGAFRSIEELMNVTGIKEGIYNKLQNKITID